MTGTSQERPRTRRFAMLVGWALLLSNSAGMAQKPLRAGMVGDPRVGQTAPDFTAPYYTAAGAGPVDQPFHLRAELGRTVVLVMGGPADHPDVVRVWTTLAAADSLFPNDVVVAGLVRSGSLPTHRLAADLGSPFKFLPDSSGRILRRFGVVGDREDTTIHVFVVGDDGRVVYRSHRFRIEDASARASLRAAVSGSG